MSNEIRKPVEVVRAFLAAMEKLDYDAALTWVAEDCEYTNMPMATVRGPAGVRGVLEPFFAPTRENEFIVKNIVADGPLVFVERLDRHRLAKGWAELPVVGVFSVHDGRITAWREYFDLATLQKGMVEFG